jgi:hypothetical protein
MQSPQNSTQLQMENQDLFSKLGGSQGDLSVGNILGDGDPFNDSTGDVFDKFLNDDFDRSNRSGGLPDANLLNDSSFQDMLDSTLDKANGGASYDMEEEGAPRNAYAFSGGRAQQNQTMNMGGGGNNWFSPANPNPEGMLNAAPLNISLGGGGVAASESSSSVASMLRRKGSNAQLHGSKFGSVRKVGLTSSKLRSAKSEGMLARALKAKYNSGNALNKYSVNAAEASAVINARFPRNSMSAMTANTSNGAFQQRPSHTNIFGQAEFDINAVEKEGSSGGKNATWGSVASRKPGASMFANLISSPDGVRSIQQAGPPLTGSNSMASLLRQQKISGGGSRTSMQDLLRLSKKQSKTQSMLRQSSAQSLLKQTSSQSLKGQQKKVDLTSLLPPNHAMMGLSISGHQPSPKITSDASKPAFGGDPMQMGNMELNSLLHQSCRLYPKTAAVVESALRIDPDAVRRAVPVTLEKGQSKKTQSVYGYPVNVAMTHGGSVEVIKMLIEAGPDVLVQKDGNDGAGSLSIALMNNVDMIVVEMLVQANPDCVKVADRRGNYPLHVAVSKGLPFPLVKRLHAIHPKALQMRNFHSQTPLDIAQRSTRCSEEVMNYLQSTAFSRLEHNANHLEQHNQADLEDNLDDIMETNF